MDLPSCGSACFQHETLYFSLWLGGMVVGFSLLIHKLNALFGTRAH